MIAPPRGSRGGRIDPPGLRRRADAETGLADGRHPRAGTSSGALDSLEAHPRDRLNFRMVRLRQGSLNAN
ncbi:protein of unassigned function [Methylobacterium oryzae CBMB20]|uniref:Protein of unassigned function n=1 Tax=Methylobacterium oryzae CBMB20 TaxID=693986 RepID=A0A089NQ84_9HYPH|nr:protein of unassigned function [Methylobacterium oryzae CBMB20]